MTRQQRTYFLKIKLTIIAIETYQYISYSLNLTPIILLPILNNPQNTKYVCSSRQQQRAGSIKRKQSKIGSTLRNVQSKQIPAKIVTSRRLLHRPNSGYKSLIIMPMLQCIQCRYISQHNSIGIFIVSREMKQVSVVACLLLLLSLVSVAVAYPVRCVEVGDSPLGTVADCDVANDPLPFKWKVTLKIKKNLKWAGADDVKIFYANPNQTVESNCSLATPGAGQYKPNSQLSFQQTCYSFEPKLMKHAVLTIMVFYTHHDTIDDVLMFNFPIPGYESNGVRGSKVVEEDELRRMMRLVGKSGGKRQAILQQK